MPPALGAPAREIRVFISSTFRDMQVEREELVKQVFPRLRRLCECRGVTWGEVDLRWGVTEESKSEGKVLPLCLAEIERCRPYFIGLLGERYGWVPEEVPEELFEAQPWLAEHRKHSVTALEILHGVLRNPQMAEHAFFYFRDPQYAEAREGFKEEDPQRRGRLAALKADIRQSGFPVRENFANPKQLGELVLGDLTALINRLFPESTLPDPLDRAAADHEAYAASRRRVYIGRANYMLRLDAHVAGDGDPLVIVGDSGGGKSALLANWTHRWRENHPEAAVLVHFIGASPESADWMEMLRQILGELRRRFGIQTETPDKPDALRMAFANALHMAAARGRVVLVLDALNQLEDRDGAPDLVWLPPVMPPNVRLIVSTLPGRPLDDLRKRGWPVLQVGPLRPEECEELIENYLRQYAKQLSPVRRKQIAAAPQAGNPLFLTTLLNELRLFGSHEQLDQRIAWYLEAAGPQQLFGKVLVRWEQDYGRPDPVCENLVRDSLTRLWAARHGLSEAELLGSLGSGDAPLPRAFWSPLFLAAGESLVNRGGLLTFAHDFLRQAVKDQYLPAPEQQRESHRALACYFDRQPQGPRKLDELPWQWQEAAEWERLARLLADPGLFDALWEGDECEVRAYWAQVEAGSPIRMERVYAATMDDVSANPDHSWRIGILLAETGKPEAALGVQARLAEYYRQAGDRAAMRWPRIRLAVILERRGDLDGAMAVYEEVEGICRELGDQYGLLFPLGNRANILYSARGDLDGAMALYKEVERICREFDYQRGLATALGNQANILCDHGDPDGAMALHKEEERICRALGDLNGLQRTLVNQALILEDRGDMDGSMVLHKEQESICRQIGDDDGLSISLGNQAVILQARGDLAGAMTLSKEKERLCRELGTTRSLALSLSHQAQILRDTGCGADARRLADEALSLATSHGYKSLASKIQRIRDSIQ